MRTGDGENHADSKGDVGQSYRPQPASAPESPVSDFLQSLLARVFARSENFVAGRFWMLEALFLAVLVSAFFSGGIDDRLWRVNNNYWFRSYFQKIEHPLLDLAKIYPPQTHDAKLNFRLTVPVILHLLGVSPERHWVLPALTAVATCGIIFASCLFAFRVSRDRVCGLYVALAVCSTYIGSFGFMLYYDAIAICQLALAMLPGLHWSLKGLLVFTASFTDERAFLVSPFLLVQTLCSRSDGKTPRECLLSSESFAVLGGMACYCAGRLALEQFAGLTSSHEGFGFYRLMYNFDFWHAGTWLALKGGWLLVGIAALSLWQRRQWLPLSAFAAMILLTLAGGFLVEDVVRSTAYVFPAFLIAFAVVAARENTRWLRSYCLAAFIISLAAGNYNVWRSQITWFKPLAADALYNLLHALFKSA
jgi:hypothetical protein